VTLTAFVPTTPADLADKRWLDQQVQCLRDGIDAARDIWLNWDSGREVKRFVDHGEYGRFIRESLGYALDLKDALQIMAPAPGVPGGSTVQIAAVAGVTQQAASKARIKASQGTTQLYPATVLGSDGKTYPAQRVEVMVPTTPTPSTKGKPATPKPRDTMDPIFNAMNAFLKTQKSASPANRTALLRLDKAIHAHFATHLMECQHGRNTK
jgi:hypothetical protein